MNTWERKDQSGDIEEEKWRKLKASEGIRESGEGIENTREQFGERLLEVTQKLFEDEKTKLEEKIIKYKESFKIAATIAVPTSVLSLCKIYGIDIEQMTGINVSENTDYAIKLASIVSAFSAITLSEITKHLDKKLNKLKEKFGVPVEAEKISE